MGETKQTSSDADHAILNEVFREVDLARTMILNAVEINCGSGGNWPLLRATLLKLLGDRGLHGRLKALLSKGGQNG